MMKEKALSYFCGSYNCAQAVRKSMEKYVDVPDEEIARLKAAGGGRAEGGTCGALHAVHQGIECTDS